MGEGVHTPNIPPITLDIKHQNNKQKFTKHAEK